MHCQLISKFYPIVSKSVTNNPCKVPVKVLVSRSDELPNYKEHLIDDRNNCGHRLSCLAVLKSERKNDVVLFGTMPGCQIKR